jgi:regulator of nucleoside diphosphate kinase
MMNRKTMLGDPPAIRLTHNDIGRLEALLAGGATESSALEFLRHEVERAIVVPERDAASLVKLGSRVAFEDETGKLYTGTVGFPIDVAGRPDSISILAPVGAALLGLTEGQSISYVTPDRRTKRLTVVRLLPNS